MLVVFLLSCIVFAVSILVLLIKLVCRSSVRGVKKVVGVSLLCIVVSFFLFAVAIPDKKELEETAGQEVTETTVNSYDLQTEEIKTEVEETVGQEVTETTSEGQTKANSAMNDSVAIELTTVAREVIYEQNNVTITVTGLEETKSTWNVNILIENNGELNLGFYAHAYGVNGIMTKNNIYDMDCDVAAGKKANTSLQIKKDVLKEIGDISQIRCIDVLFWAYDNDKYFKEFDTGQLEIRTNFYNGEHDSYAGTEIFNDGKISVQYLYHKKDGYYFCIANNIGNPVTFDFSELSINDYTDSEIDYDLYDKDLLNNCQIMMKVNVRDDFKKQNSIDSVKKIDWNLKIRPNGDYFAEEKVGPIVYAKD